tara:strand:+ start:75 stop:341 length:267 start_codon:yes stop_codon:yes gene_type:complete
LEQNPSSQKQTDLYKKVKDHIKKTGFIVNPLLVVEDEKKYKVVYGNNRYLAGVELGLKEFPIEVLKNDDPITIKAVAKKYKEVDLDAN